MTKKSSKYWQERFLNIEKSSNAYGIQTYSQIEPAFNHAQRQIEKEIDVWVARVAKNNEVTMVEARKLLNTKELVEFKWDVKEFIKCGEENALDGMWIKELENASAKFHITRLEALKIRTQQEIERAFGSELDSVDRMISNAYSNNYYKSIYEIQKGLNVGFNVASIDQRKLNLLKVKPWATDGKNFSNRIWQSKRTMIGELHNELVKTCVLGKSPDEAIKNLTKFVDKKFQNAKAQAGRLVMTEQAFFSSAAQGQCFKDLDVEKFEIVATLDSHTSEICQNLDGEVFDMKDFQAGVTAPPFHVWCRSTTVPFFDDEFDFGSQKAARGEDGKIYYVPDKMKYKDWKNQFVKEDLKEDVKSDKIELPKNLNSEIFKKIGKDNYENLHSILEDAPELERNVWVKMENDLTVVNANSNVHPCCHGTSGIEMNVSKDAKGSLYSKPYQTTFHEFGHNIDYLSNKKYGDGYAFRPYSYTYQNNIFGRTIKSEVGDRVDSIAARMKQEFKDYKNDFEWLHNKGYISDWSYDFYKKQGTWLGGEPKFSKSMAYRELEKEIRAIDKNIMANLSDIVEGATNGRVQAGFGHGKGYWKQEHKLSTEAFAEMFDSSVANPEQLEIIKQYLPKSYEIFQEMLQTILKG